MACGDGKSANTAGYRNHPNLRTRSDARFIVAADMLLTSGAGETPV
jgi:hypothetical protein